MTSSNVEGNGATYSWRHQSRVLVADGSNFRSLILNIHIDAFGAETNSVTTGAAATEHINRGEMYDLIVVDAALTDATGVEILGISVIYS